MKRTYLIISTSSIQAMELQVNDLLSKHPKSILLGGVTYYGGDYRQTVIVVEVQPLNKD